MQNSFPKSQEELVSKSSLISRNVTVMGHRTSVRLEPEMWTALKEISKRERCSIHDICGLISLLKSQNTSLTAAIRVFLMLYFRASSTAEGHKSAGHGNFEYMKHRAKISFGGPDAKRILDNENEEPPKAPKKEAMILSTVGADKAACLGSAV